jgi:hypothetical protein
MRAATGCAGFSLNLRGERAGTDAGGWRHERNVLTMIIRMLILSKLLCQRR